MQTTALRIAGSQSVNRFNLLLQALAAWLIEIPGSSYEDSPREIVRQVLGSTELFGCDNVDEGKLVGYLSCGLVMSISRKGERYNLGVTRYPMIDGVPRVGVYLT